MEEDIALISDVNVLTSKSSERTTLGSERLLRFSSWKKLVQAFARLKSLAKAHRDKTPKNNSGPVGVQPYIESEKFMIKVVHQEVFKQEMLCIIAGCPIPKDSPIISLNPVMDQDGLLRLGNADLDMNEKKPAIIPGKHHLATLLVRHYHEKVYHQGRHLTEGAVRAAGLWITGVKRLVASLIHDCVKCRKLRGRQEQQIMADLPLDRLKPNPPFTYARVDTFGPWTVATRKTRGGQSHGNRWALLFSYLVTRAIHIEVIEDMSSSSFINALRRFLAIRGKVQEFRSDRGTNFAGSTEVLGINANNVEDESMIRFLSDNQTQWRFNPPHASHMGGAWERMIGIVRMILNSMLTDVSPRFSHEVLATLMAEVCMIVNGRPIVPVSTDPEAPFILTPSTLLTQKTDRVLSPLEDFSDNIGDMYKSQWRQVQSLTDTFWIRWRREYLHTLQNRRKWQQKQPNVRNGDLVLLRDKNIHRNEWPIGVVLNAIESGDGNVRKAVVKIITNGKVSCCTRPITEMVILLSSD